ncbi:putative transposase [Mycobacteroides abscessus subsp. bolletii]|uniref:RNA-guided endonuclease InsQ/TnpB family protein n=1 Tax=Mycobacteroides abscessus TaxID=36809 RepID=UPI0009C511B7|nr:putative transposase [Mycobacteroides abscessus subsp. bolletii]
MSVVGHRVLFVVGIETVRYTYRLRPGATAERGLLAEWDRCRFLWNESVHMQRTGQKPTFAKLGKMLTEARRTTGWLREGSQNAQQQMLRTYAQALGNSFTVKGRGRPAFKARKKTLPTLEYTTRGFSLNGGRLILPKGVSIPVVWSRELPSPPTSVNIYRDSLGHWYASFVTRRETVRVPQPDSAIGIDWGVSTVANTTDARFDLQYLGHRRMCAAQLAKAQRKMARRHRKGGNQSRRYLDAKREVAKLHKKAARQTQHASRVWAKTVVDNHGLIAVEDFRPKFLAKSTMARKAADAAIGAAKRELIDRGRRAGRKVVMVQPAYTTMTCSECFAINKRLELGVRTFHCESCEHTAGRDWNAARVILAVAERGHTSVDAVRQSLSASGLVAAAS